MFERLKQHPYLYGGIAAAVFIFVLYWYGSAGGTSTSAAGAGTSDAAMQASAQLEAMNQQIQGQIGLAQIGADVQKDATAAQLQAYTIGQQTQSNANTLAAQIAELQANLSAQTTQQANTLQANVYLAQIGAQTDQARIAAVTQRQAYQTLASALVTQAALQAQTSQVAISAANQCHGVGCWF